MPLGSVPLEGSFLTYDDKDKDFTIQLTAANGRVLYLGATTKIERAVWVQTLRNH